MKRGAVKKSECKLVNVWVPQALLTTLDRAVTLTDSDRSKFIRAAIREKATSISAKEAA
jgi:metal-responsive CopG/Arc/MetJ family transcriptional regulator